MFRPFARTVLLLVLSMSPTAPLFAQEEMAEVQITAEKVAEGIYMLQGRGGNIGLAFGEDGAFLIDDQYAPLTEKVQAAVTKLTDQPLRFVLNTHWHGDHTGGNENLGQAGVLIFAHDNVRKRLQAGQVIAAFNREVPPAPADALPIVTFSETTTFHLGGETIRAIHLPHAHTDGDSIVHFRNANVVHMGDNFFQGGYPFIDVSSGGNVDGMIAAVEHALSMTNAETVFLPGHGPIASRTDLEAYRELLVTVRSSVAQLVQEGKTFEEVFAARPTQDFNEKLDGKFFGAEQFTRFVYDSLTASQTQDGQE